MHTLISEIIYLTARELCRYLEQSLPLLGADNWWKKYVLAELSHQQEAHVEKNNITKLSELDLAALLRVFEKNAYELSWKVTLPSDAKHLVRKMIEMRNRWAHVSVEETDVEGSLGEQSSLKHFALMIDADDELLKKIELFVNKDLSKDEKPSQAAVAVEISAVEGSTVFSVGQVVALKTSADSSGVVTQINAGAGETRYAVFINNEIRSYYESQLVVKSDSGSKLNRISLAGYHAFLSALQISHPNRSTLYSLNAARVDYIPYQFRPVLKFIRADRPRLLIADSVGVGKTIEAGLILKELQARGDIKSVLVICPRPLVTERKWEQEMKRFNERFTQLDGKSLRFCISEMDLEGEWPEQHAKTILPYSLFDETLLYGTKGSKAARQKKQVGLLDLDPPPKFDLVIVDEAHHIRNPDTFRHEAVRFFCDNAEAVIFLTATPIQLGSQDLYVLLNTLRPDLILDKESYAHMAGPNPYINRSIDAARSGASGWQVTARDELNNALATPWGKNMLVNDPDCQRIASALEGGDISAEQRVSIINDLEGMHTFSGIINRTRRRDIGEFTVRDPRTVAVEFTEEQRALHDALLDAQANILGKIQPNTSINFMMGTLRRQAASSLFGLIPNIRGILTRRLEDTVDPDADGEGMERIISDDELALIEEEIQTVMSMAEKLGPEDPKLAALQKLIEEKQSLLNNKLMVFSSFRHTLSYLNTALAKCNVRVGMVHGDTPDDERVRLRNQFRSNKESPDALDVLLFSEVGCEGLDYQFCDCIVNYDLPWNPMRIEQRIGRIDRRGQKSEKVLIYNMITPGTVDADIYERCLLRIGIFEREIGAGEEILGQIASEIRSIGEDLTLTMHERQEKLQQIADNDIRVIYEQQVLEDKQAELFGVRLPPKDVQKDIEDASSYWLTPPAIENMVAKYISSVSGQGQENILGEKNLKTLRVSQEGRSRLLKDLQLLPRSSSPDFRAWERWAKGGDQHLQVTFDASTAADHPDVVFITPQHPLARQAAQALSPKERQVTAIEIYDDELPAGKHFFAIYEWSYSGIKEDVMLLPVALDQKVTKELSRCLEFGNEMPLNDGDLPGQSEIDALEDAHYQKWQAARETHQQQTKKIAEYRRESLSTSHRARMSVLAEQSDKATNDKIRRMRKSQIANAEVDYQRRIKELDKAEDMADIHLQVVAYGLLHVRKG